jgi:hypothetical protein
MSVYDEIKAERDYQIGKWGNESDDTKNTPWMWAAYIAQYATRWMSGKFTFNSDEDTGSFRQAMIKTAAIAIAAVESLDRQNEESGKPFYQE